MFDEYIPRETFHCPACESELTGWQGKDGPCALLTWQEGLRVPVGQSAEEESAIPKEALASFTLPPAFTIYTICPIHHQFLYARCLAANGVWTSTELVTRGEDS